MTAATMHGGPLDGRTVTIANGHTVLSTPVPLWRGRGRIWTQDEYEAEVTWTYPPAPEPCPACGHYEDSYEAPVRHEPVDLEAFFATARYREANGWTYEPPSVLPGV